MNSTPITKAQLSINDDPKNVLISTSGASHEPKCKEPSRKKQFDRSAAKPSPSSPALEYIPEELKQIRQWVCWDYVRKNGKWEKVPINARTGAWAENNNPDTWSNFEDARAFLQQKHPAGVGYVFSDEDPHVGIDIDDCRDPDTGQLNDEAKTIIRELASYAEVSPSRTGVKIIVSSKSKSSLRTRLGVNKKKTGHYEIFLANVYFTLTGQVVEAYREIAEADETLEWYVNRFIEKEKPKPSRNGCSQRPAAPSASVKLMLDKLRGVEETRKGWRALCPAHDDHHPSLDIKQGDDGRAVFICRTGCSQDAVLNALGLSWADLMGDAARRIETNGSKKNTTRRGQNIERPVSSTQNEKSVPSIERFKPFPVDVLPEPIRGFIIEGAKAIGCDPSYLALPILCVLATAIGNTRCIQLKWSWVAPAILWAVIVGESGTLKTPPFKLALKPIRDRQKQDLKRYGEAVKQYEADLANYEKSTTAWKRAKNTTDKPPTKPEMPQAVRCIVSDTTVEALAPILLANKRGLMLARDELSGWIGSFDQYKKTSSRSGADAAHWLSMHNAESILVDRKTGNPRIILVPHAWVSVCGGIQPGILHRALGNEHRESGLAARLLMTCPPRKAKRWTDADIDPDTEAKYAQIADRLFELQTAVNEEGEPCPIVVTLTPDAKEIWVQYFNSHAKEQVDLTGDLAAAWSKLEEYAARLALVIHCTRWAANDPTLSSADMVDATSMAAGIQLAEWFKHETLRVYGLMNESEENRELRRLVEWIDRKEGEVTIRDVQQGCRWLKESGKAEEALERLRQAELGEWIDVSPTDRGGRPTHVFKLHVMSTSTKPRKPGGNECFVDSRHVDTGVDEEIKP